jgi:hypothetical protein
MHRLRGPNKGFLTVLSVHKLMRGSGGYGESGLRVVSEIDVKESIVRDMLHTVWEPLTGAF